MNNSYSTEQAPSLNLVIPWMSVRYLSDILVGYWWWILWLLLLFLLLFCELADWLSVNVLTLAGNFHQVHHLGLVSIVKHTLINTKHSHWRQEVYELGILQPCDSFPVYCCRLYVFVAYCCLWLWAVFPRWWHCGTDPPRSCCSPVMPHRWIYGAPAASLLRCSDASESAEYHLDEDIWCYIFLFLLWASCNERF